MLSKKKSKKKLIKIIKIHWLKLEKEANFRETNFYLNFYYTEWSYKMKKKNEKNIFE